MKEGFLFSHQIDPKEKKEVKNGYSFIDMINYSI